MLGCAVKKPARGFYWCLLVAVPRRTRAADLRVCMYLAAPNAACGPPARPPCVAVAMA
jgi:hypothetical protein